MKTLEFPPPLNSLPIVPPPRVCKVILAPSFSFLFPFTLGPHSPPHHLPK